MERVHRPGHDDTAQPRSAVEREVADRDHPFWDPDTGEPMAAFEAPSWVYLFESETQVRALAPDFRALLAASELPVIVTAPGDSVDFVSRFFGPQVGIDEDPVTGSAHCALVPLWAQRLGKTAFEAKQVSPRGGDLYCELQGERVMLRGVGLTFLRGQIEI